MIADVSTPAIMKLNQVFLCCVDEICFDGAYRYFPVPVLLSTYHGGRVAESEWDPIRGSATQNWLEECSKKTEKLQIRLLGSSLKSIADTTLFLELTLRVYNISKLRDNEMTVQIIKIG